jgi:hypothetical protein
MSGQIASLNVFSLELVALIVGVSMVLGAVDLIRQPGWAWKRAEESKTAYLVLVVLLPLVGLGMYVFNARPKVVEIASAGRAASLPFERFGEGSDLTKREDGLPTGTIAAPVGFTGFGGQTDGSSSVVPDMETAMVGAAGRFFSTGGASTHAAQPAVGVVRTYRPKQRASLPGTEAVAPTVPAGWKADPTGRHQFRYWDGSHWTENVADAGVQAIDSVVS